MIKAMITSATLLSFISISPSYAQNQPSKYIGNSLFKNSSIATDITKNTDDQVHLIYDWESLQTNRSPSWSEPDQRHVLPQNCLRYVETGSGEQQIFGRRCLERNFRYVNDLPHYCAVRIYSYDGPNRGFDPYCLHDAGYRTDRRN